LVEVQSRLQTISAEFQKLPTSTEGLDEDKKQAASEQRVLIAKNLDFVGSALESIGQEFSFSEEERAVIFRLIAQKHADLRKLMQQQVEMESEEKKSKEEGKGD